jgi:pimeloyl-ACP methyl ester carboxylesterase
MQSLLWLLISAKLASDIYGKVGIIMLKVWLSYLAVIGVVLLVDGSRRAVSSERLVVQKVETGQGQTAFRQEGEGPETLILVAGFSIPSAVYDRQMSLGRDLKLLTYDHYGRGESDRPRVPYTRELYLAQLEKLIEERAIVKPFHLLGQSMGAAIATLYANRHPDKVKSLILLCPAGLGVKTPFSQKILTLPFLGDLLIAWFGDRLLQRNFPQNFAGPPPEALAAAYGQQFGFPAYKQALLSTLRDFDFQHIEADYQSWGQRRKPTLVLWGTADQIIPVSYHKRLMELVPHSQLKLLEGAGHAISYENAELVNASIQDFIRQQAAVSGY